MKWIKRMKLKNIFNYITLFLLVPFATVLVLLFVYTAHLNVSHEKNILQVAAEDIVSSMESSVSGIFEDARYATYSNNFLYFSNSSEFKTVDTYAQDFLLECRAALFPYSEVIGVFLSNSRCGAYYSSFNYFDALFLTNKVKDLLQAEPEILEDGSITVQKLDETPYLFYSISERYGTITIMADLNKDAKFTNYNSIYQETARFFFSETPVSGEASLCRKLERVPLYLVCQYHTHFAFSQIQKVLLIVILLLLIAIPVSLWLLTRLIARPLRTMTDAMQVITAGNFDSRIPPVHTIDDIVSYGQGINMMLDAIQRYKEDDFRSRMDAAQAKLQYLQLQIRPHFYLNCMKSLNSLIDLREYDKAQMLIYSLSNYISHAFSDIKDFVTVREELESIQSYVNLCNALSYNIHLDFSLSGQCIDMDCLPMSVLTFVENSIKHTKTGSELLISICVETFRTEENEELMKFTLRDSGGGFPEEVLQEQVSADPSRMVYRRKHIGIANVRYRLYLVFGQKASLHFHNEDGNAVVEIVTPCSQGTERTKL